MTTCSICSQLGDHTHAMQKHGHEAEDSFLPEAASKLKFLRELKPGYTRYTHLLRCPECGTHFIFESGYENLATGSEDTQSLVRLTAAEARRFTDGGK